MARITKKVLLHEIEILNSFSVHHYGLYGAYGKVKLVEEMTNSGIKDITPLMTSAELYKSIEAIIYYLMTERC